VLILILTLMNILLSNLHHSWNSSAPSSTPEL
jgi:hypothetical protein